MPEQLTLKTPLTVSLFEGELHNGVNHEAAWHKSFSCK